MPANIRYPDSKFADLSIKDAVIRVVLFLLPIIPCGLLIAISDSPLIRAISITAFPVILAVSFFPIASLGMRIRTLQPQNPFLCILSIILGLPLALFGLLCLAAGLGILIATTYHYVINPLPIVNETIAAITRPFRIVLAAPILALFGYMFLAVSFAKPGEGPRPVPFPCFWRYWWKS